MSTNNNKIELWEGYEVEVDEKILNDFDYITDLNKAEKVIHEKIPYIKESGMETKEICRCKYFEVYKDRLDSRDGIEFQNDNKSFRVLLCIEGNGKIIYNEEQIMFYKGDCIFVPANSVKMKISGNAEILNINC